MEKLHDAPGTRFHADVNGRLGRCSIVVGNSNAPCLAALSNPAL